MTTIPSTDENHVVRKRWSLGETPWQKIPPVNGTRARIIIDNDFSGDPDDLYQLVHHLLSPNLDIRYVIGSHLREGDPFDPGPCSAENAVAVARDLFHRMGLDSTELIVEGSNQPLVDARTPQASAAAEAIVAEAMRDVGTPLYYLAGGGLTDLASAILMNPEIAHRMTLIWIGGAEHDGHAAPPPDAMPVEYNLLIDILAGQVIFNESDIEIWQVPRNVYRQCLVSDAELRTRVATAGSLGSYLYDEVRFVVQRATNQHRGPAETYVLGDSPLVLLTALQSLFEADPSSSQYQSTPTPSLEKNGGYTPNSSSRQMRVYQWVDTRLMFEDFFIKLDEFARWQFDGDS